MTDRQAYIDHPAMSCSTATALLNSCPAQVLHDLQNPSEPTAQMDFGKIGHQCVVEGKEITELYIVVPKGFSLAQTTKYAKTIARIEETGLPIIREPAYDAICRMRDALLEHEVAMSLLVGQPEAPVYWRCGISGLRCKALFDVMPSGFVFGDYKTVHSLDNPEIQRQAANLNWSHRAWWYLDGAQFGLGIEAPQYAYICQDKRPPHLVRVLMPSPEHIRQAGREMLNQRMRWAECMARAHYPGWDEIEFMGLPHWEKTRLEIRAEELADALEYQKPLEQAA